MRMAQEIGDAARAADYVKAKRANKEAVMGFGHRVYRAEDPRARHMRAGVEALSREMGEPRWYQILEALVEAMKPYARHGVNVNVDFYAGVVYFLNGIAEDLFVPVFAVGRVPGWTVQVMEQLENNILIRPLTLYDGPARARLRPHRRALTRVDALREDDGRGRDDILDARAAREVAQRTREALQYRPDRPRAAEVLAELVGDVAGVEVGEHQHVGSSRRRARRPSASSRRRRDSTPRPPASRRRSRAPARGARDGERAHDLVDMRVRGAAFGRERQQRDARFLAQHAAAARGGRERDVGERLGRRIGIHRAIGKDQRALRRTA